MAGFLFQWIRGLFRQRHGKKQRRARGKRPSRRDAYLRLETLEDRVLFSANVWMPERLNPVGGMTQNNQNLQMFQPVGIDLGLQTGLNSGNMSLAANYSLVDTGAYSLSLQESGSQMGTYTFTETGTITFSLSEQGTEGASGFSVTSLVLTQTATLNYTFSEPGMPMMNQSGTYSFTTVSSGTNVIDPEFWQGMNWADPTRELLQDKSLSMVFGGTANITATETNGTESYTFSVNNGQETITGNGTQMNAGDMLQSGQQSYAYSNEDSFSFSNQGADTFTLSEQGSCSEAMYSLSSVAYSETGNGGGGQSLGYGFQYSETGAIGQSGTASMWSNQSASASSVSLRDTSNESIQSDSNLTYSYDTRKAGRARVTT